MAVLLLYVLRRVRLWDLHAPMSPLEGILRLGRIGELAALFSPPSGLLAAAGEREDAGSIFGAQGDVEAWTIFQKTARTTAGSPVFSMDASWVREGARFHPRQSPKGGAAVKQIKPGSFGERRGGTGAKNICYWLARGTCATTSWLLFKCTGHTGYRSE